MYFIFSTRTLILFSFVRLLFFSRTVPYDTDHVCSANHIFHVSTRKRNGTGNKRDGKENGYFFIHFALSFFVNYRRRAQFITPSIRQVLFEIIKLSAVSVCDPCSKKKKKKVKRKKKCRIANKSWTIFENYSWQNADSTAINNFAVLVDARKNTIHRERPRAFFFIPSRNLP